MAIINTNISSINAQNNLARTQGDLQTSLQRLSSGLRINSAKDDAAGLAITNRQTAQIRGLNQAARNANDGISVAQVAEGAMQESTNILQRMRELALQAANGTNSASDRDALQKEVAALQAEMSRIADTTSFGTQKLLDGTYGSQNLQVGFAANQTISISLQNVSADAIGGQSISGAGTTITGTTAAAAINFTAGTIEVTNNSTSAVGIFAVAAGDDTATVADSINAISATTGVTADAYNELEFAISFDNGEIAAGSLTTSQGTVDFAGGGVSTLQQFVDAVNSSESTTGLSASIDAESGNVRVVSSDGYDIDIGAFSFQNEDTLNAATITIDSVVDGTAVGAATNAEANAFSTGVLTLNSTDSFSVAQDSGAVVTQLFGAASSSLSTVESIDIGTASGAQEALSIIDGALAFIDSSRASLGALQNRLESTISNLSNISENVSAARSRILDANFAQETANLTRIQILQQAGTSILAQANAAPQSVLTLLQ